MLFTCKVWFGDIPPQCYEGQKKEVKSPSKRKKSYGGLVGVIPGDADGLKLLIFFFFFPKN